jgi:hypothetical protein
MTVNTGGLAILSGGSLYMAQPYFAAARPLGPAPMMQMDFAVVRRPDDDGAGIAPGSVTVAR